MSSFDNKYILKTMQGHRLIPSSTSDPLSCISRTSCWNMKTWLFFPVTIPVHVIHCLLHLSTEKHVQRALHQLSLVIQHCRRKWDQKKKLAIEQKSWVQQEGEKLSYLQPELCLILRTAAIIWTIHASCPSIKETSLASPPIGSLALSYGHYINNWCRRHSHQTNFN